MERKIGASRCSASAKASSPQGHHSTGLSLCCKRYGLVASAKRFTMLSLRSSDSCITLTIRDASGTPGDLAITVIASSALWLHGLAERPPDRHEIAVPVNTVVPESLKRRMRVVHFSARLTTAALEQLPVHQPATILAHLATKPGDVRDWTTFAEALPDLAERSPINDLDKELHQRPTTVRPRLAYLLSGVAPKTADLLQPTKPNNVTWFGRSRVTRRFDKRFNVADGLLPFDPRELTEAT